MRRLVLVVLLLAASCAGQRPSLEGESAAREVDAAAFAAADDTVADDAPTEAAVPDPTRTFRMAVVGEWSGDPADAGPASLTDRVIADLLFEGLTRLDRAGRPEAALAQRWFVSEDRVTWTFVLRSGLTDGLGEPLTARDVKRSLEQVAARGPADQAATALTAVAGWEDHMAGDSGGVSGLSAPDESTLVVTLDSPFELLPAVLASPSYGITGTSDDGETRTTGAYRYGAGEGVLDAVDPAAPIQRIELLRTDTETTPLVADGLVDWAVLPPDAAADGLEADVIRQPLDLEVVLVARMRTASERRGALSVVEPVTLAAALDALSPRVAPGPKDEGAVPESVLIDIPEGLLEPIGAGLVAQFADAGLQVLPVTSSAADFAGRVASGDAVLFPAVMAGGTGGAGGLLRLATPGGVDDVFGPDSDARRELAAAVAGATDPDERRLFLDALERSLIDDGFLLPVGVFEVRVAVARTVTGLHHRADGTIDLTGVRIVEP